MTPPPLHNEKKRCLCDNKGKICECCIHYTDPCCRPRSEAREIVICAEGRKLQDAAGIQSVNPDGYCGNTLYSEDLY